MNHANYAKMIVINSIVFNVHLFGVTKTTLRRKCSLLRSIYKCRIINRWIRKKVSSSGPNLFYSFYFYIKIRRDTRKFADLVTRPSWYEWVDYWWLATPTCDVIGRSRSITMVGMILSSGVWVNLGNRCYNCGDKSGTDVRRSTGDHMRYFM